MLASQEKLLALCFHWLQIALGAWMKRDLADTLLHILLWSGILRLGPLVPTFPSQPCSLIVGCSRFSPP